MKHIFSILFLLDIFIGVFGQAEEDTSEIKPDTAAAFVRTWKLSEDFTILEDFELDTMQTGFQVYNPVFKQSISNSYIGNLGLHCRSNLYFSERPDQGFFFLNNLEPYLSLPERNMYFNIRKPFSMVEYFNGGGGREKREETIRGVHTQNFGPFLNAGFDLRLTGSEGHYINQKSGLSNSSLWSSYIKDDYSIHGSIHYNSFKLAENGGLADDSLFTNTKKDSRAYNVNLEEGKSETKNLIFHITQRYRFGKEEEMPDSTSETGFNRWRERTTKTGSFIHSLSYNRNSRKYSDKFSEYNQDFYENYFIDSAYSEDRSFYRSFNNTLQLMLDENPNRQTDFGARAFASLDLVKYSHNIPTDTLVVGQDTTLVNNRDYSYSNLMIGASLVHTVGEGWNWVFTGKYYVLGYRSGDLLASGRIDKMIHTGRGDSRVSVSGSIRLFEADHFLNHFASNNFIWQNNFRKTKEIRGALRYQNSPRRIRASVQLSLLSDFVYLDYDARPVQFGKVINIIALDFSKHFIAGPFHSIHKFNYQFASNRNIIRIPDLSYYTSDFLAFPIVKNVLTAEIGFDLSYYTKYSAYAFMPATGQFYRQDEKKMGNYPYLDFFLTAKLKRTRFYVRLDHSYANAIKKNYFHVLDYPMPGMTFKFGISWTFYD